MKYIDVRVRIPVKRMGSFVEEVLPDWATMVGYDRLEGQSNSKIDDDGYKPGKGTAAESVLRLLKHAPLRRFEIINRLSLTKKEKAVSSAIQGLITKGILTKNEDGAYERN